MPKLLYKGSAYATYFHLFDDQEMPLTQPSVLRLVNSGFDINAVDVYGQTLLIYSLRLLQPAITSYLLEQGASWHVNGSSHAVFDLLSAKRHFDGSKKSGYSSGEADIFEKLFWNFLIT